VAAEGGGEIQLDPALIHRISSEGVLYASDPAEEIAEEVEIGRLLLRNAENIDLEKMEDGLFKVLGAEATGDFEGADAPVQVTSQALEGSSVKSYDVLTRMIEIERGYEMKINIIKALGDMGEKSQSLMQLN
jgi:flagellar basal body rod protein FlgF